MLKMRGLSWVVIGCAISFWSGCSTSSGQGAGEQVVEQGVQANGLLPEAVLQAIEARVVAGEYPAIVIAVADGDAQQVYSFGKLEGGQPADGDTLFEIGSVTKTFTSLLLADAVVNGQVKLEDSAAVLVPDWKLPVRTEPGTEPLAMTLQQIATHHSGLPRLPGNMTPEDAENPYADYDAEKLKAFLESYELTRDPGSSFEYSNLGYGFLGYALGVSAGSSYEKLVEEKIFEPLGMKRSAVHRGGKTQENVAGGHAAYGQGAVGGWDFDVLAGAGSILSTGNDMLRYLNAQRGALETPLAEAIALTHRTYVEGPAAGEGLGLGWIQRKVGGQEVVWHSGMTGGFASFMGFTVDGQRGVVVLTNTQMTVDDLGFAALTNDAQAELRAPRVAVAMSADELAEYEGSYALAPEIILQVFVSNGELHLQATGQGAFPVYPSARDKFFAGIADIGVTFERDADGKISGLVLHQNGNHPAPRMSEEQVDSAMGQKEVKLESSVLEAYVGRYALELPGGQSLEMVVTLRDGQLYVQLPGQEAFPVYASALDKFFYRVVNAQIDFVRDEKGGVTGLVLHQGGASMPATRVESGE